MQHCLAKSIQSGASNSSIACGRFNLAGGEAAAIQGLNPMVEAKERRIRELEKTMGELKELVRELAATWEQAQ